MGEETLVFFFFSLTNNSLQKDMQWSLSTKVQYIISRSTNRL